MVNRSTVLTLTAFLLGAAGATARAATVYVDASMLPGVGRGTSWGDAFERVQQGIDAALAAGGGEVWVREGTYYENVGIPDGVAVYGGFAGGELTRSERDPAKHVTIIDGGRLNNVVSISGGPATRIDGFTIQNGLVSLNKPSGMLGGGIRLGGQAVVSNNVIRWNAADPGWGGGVLVLEGGGSPLITGNVIYENRANMGGGVFAISASPRMVGNVATDNQPAGLAVWASSALIVNNVALRNGSGISLASSRSAYVGNNDLGNNGAGISIDLDFSSVIANNYLFSNGVGVNSYNTVVTDPAAVVNNAFFQNSQIASTTITVGAGNINASCVPNSLSLTGGFHLTPGSPCVDAGLSSALPADLLTDRDGEPRVVGAAVDIGADELAFPVTYLSAAGTAGRQFWFTTPVNVTLAAAGAPGGPVVIGTEYTVDGGATWLPYAGPVPLAEEGLVTRLGYRSTASDGATEAVELAKEVVIGVDTLAPTLDVSVPPLPANGWYTTAPTVTVTTSDPRPGSGIETVKWGCGTYAGTAYTAPFPFTCEGAPSTLTVETRDRAGNVRTSTVPLMVDIEPPRTSTGLNPYPYGGWLRTDTVATVYSGNVGSGVALVEYGFDGVNWQPYSIPFTISTEGRNVVFTRAWDPLGRVGEVTQTAADIDRTPPSTTVAFAGASAGGWYSSDVTVTLDAGDALSGVSQIRYGFDGGTTWQYAGFGSTFTIATEGTTPLSLSAVDRAGNVEEVRTVSVRVDRTPPTTTARIDGAAGPDGRYVSPVSITLTAADAFSGVAATTYRVDGGPPQVYAGLFTVSGDGSHDVAFASTDVAGNVETAAAPLSFRIDATPPVCSLVPSGVPGPGGWWTSPVTLVAQASDAQSMVTALDVSIDGGQWMPYAGPLTLGTEGARVVACRATDASGNVGTAQLAIPIDLACPTTTATLAGTYGLAGWFTSNVTLSLAATDAASGVDSTAYSLDGLLWLPYAAPLTLSAEGLTTVQYRSTDHAGCVEAPPGAVAVSIDKTPPARVSSSPAPGQGSVSRTAVITVTYSEDVWADVAFANVTLTYVRGSRTYNIPLTPTFSGRQVTLRPTTSLAAATLHTVTLPAGAVRDVAGLRSATDAFSFSTR